MLKFISERAKQNEHNFGYAHFFYSKVSTFVVVATLSVTACTEKPAEPQTSGTASVMEQDSAPAVKPVRVNDPEQLKRGAALFQQNCAVCHGAMAQGNPNWRIVGADGKALPPPLNGTGHDWHHPTQGLKLVIKNGSPGGAGNMPAWEGKLTDQQIDDIIAWFQSLWPEEVYEAWTRIDANARNR